MVDLVPLGALPGPGAPDLDLARFHVRVTPMEHRWNTPKSLNPIGFVDFMKSDIHGTHQDHWNSFGFIDTLKSDIDGTHQNDRNSLGFMSKYCFDLAFSSPSAQLLLTKQYILVTEPRVTPQGRWTRA